MLAHALVVGIGGFVGAAARYLAGGLVHRHLPATFPWGTFFVNVVGCFGIGALAVLVTERQALGPTARLFWMVGVLGGFTTFSTFGYETASLMEDRSYVLALLNALGQLFVGLLGVFAGAAAARSLP
jgi:CrcB protein